MDNHYELGSLETSEELIKDLYIDLRTKVNKWSTITQQTPQARMGYIGQHLVSIVTGFPGGKSGARGYDLVLSPTEYGEIKTCYRVDQLGCCMNCGAPVSSLETKCARCGSESIDRKQDSKWLITINNDDEFETVLDPKYYYLVLFEFDDILDANDDDIIASIWQVDPKSKGFALCMIDYYLNIRASRSKAPFNLWPYMLKFYLMKPELIYRSVIKENNEITTEVFPTLGNTYKDPIPNLADFSRSRNLDIDTIRNAAVQLDFTLRSNSKSDLLLEFQTARVNNNIVNDYLCDILAEAMYMPLISDKLDLIPEKLKRIIDL